jgi:glycine oxidase
MDKRARGFDVVVVGGGAVGASVAYHLAREGREVVVLERDDVAAHASGAAAGMLAPIGESADGGPFLRAGLASLALLRACAAELRERSGVDPELEDSGVLRVACDEAEAARLRARQAALAGLDLDLAWLDAREARALEPALAPDLAGALWSPREAHVRSPLLARAFARAAEQHGAAIERGSAVTELVREGDRVRGVRTRAGALACDDVVVCAGAWTRSLAAASALAFEPPIEPVRGQVLSIDAPVPAFRAIVWGESAYLVPKRDGSVVVGATEERVGFDCRVTADAVALLSAAGPRLVPALGASRVRGAWAGLRPGTPDHLPLIGAWPGLSGLWIAAGHHRNGVLLAPITGRWIADAILGKALPPEAAAFAPERFAALS